MKRDLLQLIRLLLWPLAWLYAIVVTLRGWLYDLGVYSSYTVDVPTIGVGNLTVGGTGKTPIVLYLCQRLSEYGQVAMLSRGYGRRTQGFRFVLPDDNPSIVGDEPLEIKRALPDSVVVAVCEDRVEGVRRIKEAYPRLMCVILDDAYQHRRIKLGLNLLLTDYNRLFITDSYLPTGNLRDTLLQRYRADAIMVTKSPQDLSAGERSLLKRELAGKHQQFFVTSIAYSHFARIMDLQRCDIPQGSRLLALTAIANPDPFLRYLRRHYAVEEILVKRDHAPFSKKDVDRLVAFLSQGGYVVTTMKDATRLREAVEHTSIDTNRLLALSTSIAFHGEGKTHFDALVDEYCKRADEADSHGY